jgi:hypothetical protein
MPPLTRRRPLLRAAMAGAVGYAAGRHSPRRARAADSPVPETERIQTLEKLKSLRDSGVLTEEQFNREKERILGE